MHIDSLSAFHVALPRKRPQIIAGRPCETLETVLVRLTSGGAVGWGEAAPGNAPTHSGEWAGGVFALLRDWLAPAVVKTEIDSGKMLAERARSLARQPICQGGAGYCLVGSLGTHARAAVA